MTKGGLWESELVFNLLFCNCAFSSMALQYHFSFIFSLTVVATGWIFHKHLLIKVPQQHQSKSKFTYCFAHACGKIHLIATTTFTLVTAF